jgi:hypothetical protein
LAGRADARRRVRRGLAASALACALTPAAALAAAHPTPTPSAKELWRTYPLQATPAPSAAAQSPAAAPAQRELHRASGGGGSIAPVLAVAACALAGAALWTRRRGTPREPVARAATAAGTPPDPELAWTAEIGWSANGGRAAFLVTAERPGRAPETLAATSPVPWPPPDAGAIESVSAAVATLADDLLRAGWRELPAGETWYARRFAWDGRAGDRRFVPREDHTTTETS